MKPTLTPEVINELKSFLVERIVDNMSTKDLEEYVTDSFEMYVHLVPTTFCYNQDELDELYSSYMTDGYEGQMIRLDEKYENKRSKYLLKRKEFITEEFEVVSMEGV